jgi:hypothetical protein
MTIKVRLLAIAVAASVSAYANELTMDWVSAGNNPAGYYYVSPYTAQVQGTGQILTLYCIDFNHEVAPPLQWSANLQSFSLANVANMQYGNDGSPLASTWVQYEAAAWLITQLISPGNANSFYLQDIDQYAAWKIFLYPSNAWTFQGSENAVGGSTFINQVNAAYNAAFDAVANGYVPTGWDILTPNPPGSPTSTQEFLVPAPDPPASAPEPGSLILLCTVFCAAFLVAWKSRSLN